MPKKIPCTHITCFGREYEGLGFNNPTVHAEFVHNLDYSENPPGSEHAYFVDQGVVEPGTIRKPINGFDP